MINSITAIVMLVVTVGVNLILENLLQPVLLGDSPNAAPLLAVGMDARRELKKSGFFDEPE